MSNLRQPPRTRLATRSRLLGSAFPYTEDSTGPPLRPSPTPTPTPPPTTTTPRSRAPRAPARPSKVYSTADCSGAPLASGTAAHVRGAGLTVAGPWRSDHKPPGNRHRRRRQRLRLLIGAAPTPRIRPAPAAPTITDTDPDSPANDNNPEVKGSAEAGSTVKIYSTVRLLRGTAGERDPGPVRLARDHRQRSGRSDHQPAGNRDGRGRQCLGLLDVAPLHRGFDAARGTPRSPTPTPTPPPTTTTRRSRAPPRPGRRSGSTATRMQRHRAGPGSAQPPSTGAGSRPLSPAIRRRNLRATATDSAGNTGGCSAAFPYTEDSTPPGAPQLTDTDPDSPANDNNPEVKGTAAAGSTVKVYSTADCSGAPLATGTTCHVQRRRDHRHRPRRSDHEPAGDRHRLRWNASVCSSALPYTEDSTGPPAPTITDTDPDSPANDNNPEVKGSAEAGSTVRIYCDATCSGSAACNRLRRRPQRERDHHAGPRRPNHEPAGDRHRLGGERVRHAPRRSATQRIRRRLGHPSFTDTDPDSPANDNNPEVKGSAGAGSTVRIYGDAGL